jgi:hypothetical protein
MDNIIDTENEQVEKIEDEYIPKYDADEVLEEFNKLGIRYSTKSVVYLKRKGLSFSQMLEYDEYNTIMFVAAGLDGVVMSGKDSNEDRAVELLDKWLDKGYTFREIHFLCYQQGTVNGFFTTTDEILFMAKMKEKMPDLLSSLVIANMMQKAGIVPGTGNN